MPRQGLRNLCDFPNARRYLVRESKRSLTWEHVIFIASFSSHSFRKSIITWYVRCNQEGWENIFESGTSPTALSNRHSIHHNHALLLQRIAEAVEA